MDIQQRAENCTANKEDAAKFIQKFGESLGTRKGA